MFNSSYKYGVLNPANDQKHDDEGRPHAVHDHILGSKDLLLAVVLAHGGKYPHDDQLDDF